MRTPAILVLLAAMQLLGCSQQLDSDPERLDAHTVEADGGVESRSAALELSAAAEHVAVPICGSDEPPLEGTRATVCTALDSPCGRGVLEVAASCCRLAPVPVGAACGEGLRCDEAGACVPAASLATELPTELDGRVIGTEHWISGVDGRAPELRFGESFIALEVEGAGVEVSLPPESPLDLSSLRLIDPASTGTIGILGAGATALELATRASELCVVRVDEVGVTEADCTGGTRVACPTDDDAEITCRATAEGRWRVRGADLALLFPITAGGMPRGPLRPVILPGCIPGLPCSPSSGVCTPGQVSGCTTSCGTSGLRTCSYLRRWGSCRGFLADDCDGADDDCDGRIDEDGAASCDDDLSCSRDTCVAGTCRHTTTSQCQGTSPALCAYPVCAARPPAAPSGAVVANYIPGGPNCFHVRHDDWCADTWDQCDANGREVCQPYLPGADRNSGCAPQRRADHPCERDENLCSLEGGCESNPNCRLRDTILEGVALRRCEARALEHGAYVRLWNGRRLACFGAGGFPAREYPGVAAACPGTAQPGPELPCGFVGPPTPMRVTRQGWAPAGVPVSYWAEASGCPAAIVPSCHDVSCGAGCVLNTTRYASVCGERFGCAEPVCSADVTEAFGGRIGCRLQLHDELCASALPPGNECLLGRCAEDGSCDVEPTPCEVPPGYACPPGEFPLGATCNVTNGRCDVHCQLIE